MNSAASTFRSPRSRTRALASLAPLLLVGLVGCGPVDAASEAGAEEGQVLTEQQALESGWRTVIWPSAAVRAEPNACATKWQVLYSGEKFYVYNGAYCYFGTSNGCAEDKGYAYGYSYSGVAGYVRCDALR